MIRKVGGRYRLYSMSKSGKGGKRRNLGTFRSLKAAKRHEALVKYVFKPRSRRR